MRGVRYGVAAICVNFATVSMAQEAIEPSSGEQSTAPLAAQGSDEDVLSALRACR